MLAFSAVTQFPTNGSSTRAAGESVQACTSAEHVMTAEKRKICIASPELGTTRTFLAKLARRCSRQAAMRPYPPTHPAPRHAPGPPPPPPQPLRPPHPPPTPTPASATAAT